MRRSAIMWDWDLAMNAAAKTQMPLRWWHKCTQVQNNKMKRWKNKRGHTGTYYSCNWECIDLIHMISIGADTDPIKQSGSDVTSPHKIHLLINVIIQFRALTQLLLLRSPPQFIQLSQWVSCSGVSSSDLWEWEHWYRFSTQQGSESVSGSQSCLSASLAVFCRCPILQMCTFMIICMQNNVLHVEKYLIVWLRQNINNNGAQFFKG